MKKVVNFDTFLHIVRVCSNNTDDAIFLALMIECYWRYSGCRFPLSSETMEAYTGLSSDKARRCYKRLNELGFVVKTVRRNQIGTPVNHYEVDIDTIQLALNSRK
jgi:hypothetical protein